MPSAVQVVPTGQATQTGALAFVREALLYQWLALSKVSRIQRQPARWLVPASRVVEPKGHALQASCPEPPVSLFQKPFSQATSLPAVHLPMTSSW